MLVESKTHKIQKEQQQIADFIHNLQGRTQNLKTWANHTIDALKNEGFETYLEFRDLVIECESFNEVIQRRLKKAEANGTLSELQEQLDLLTARQLTLAIRASLKFLRYIAEKNLPLGSRDIFIQELHELARLKKNLDRKSIQNKVDAQALEDQEKVEEILNIVIEKAPKLFSFDTEEYRGF